MLSARTIEPNLVVRPSSVGSPPRSRTLTQPSQTRSRVATPYAAAATGCSPRRDVELAAVMRTSTRSPGDAEPAKLAVVLRRGRARRGGAAGGGAPSPPASSPPPPPAPLRSPAAPLAASTRRPLP